MHSEHLPLAEGLAEFITHKQDKLVGQVAGGTLEAMQIKGVVLPVVRASQLHLYCLRLHTHTM